MVSTKKHWSKEIRARACELRESGKSYSQITKELGVGKSTLSGWLKDLPISQKIKYSNRKDWLTKIRPMGVAANKKINQERHEKEILKAREEIAGMNINTGLCKAILSMLYWGEGSKGPHSILVFANTDPRLLLLFITLLRQSYQIDEKKFRVRLHLHYYHKVGLVKKYWSELLKVPLDQFGKIYHKKRSKEKTFRKNFGGICFLKYNSVYLQREISQHAFALGEKIAPVA